MPTQTEIDRQATAAYAVLEKRLSTIYCEKPPSANTHASNAPQSQVNKGMLKGGYQ